MAANAKEISCYLAGPDGFFDGGREFMDKKVIPMVRRAGLVPVEPFLDGDGAIAYLFEKYGHAGAIKKLEDPDYISHYLGGNNDFGIRRCSVVLARLEAGPDVGLDGRDRQVGKMAPQHDRRGRKEVDLGTGVEVGVACAIARRRFMRVIGVRTSDVNVGETDRHPVNLQCMHAIRSTGGVLVRSWEEAEAELGKVAKKVKSLLETQRKSDPLKLDPHEPELTPSEETARRDLREWHESTGRVSGTTRRYRKQ